MGRCEENSVCRCEENCVGTLCRCEENSVWVGVRRTLCGSV